MELIESFFRIEFGIKFGVFLELCRLILSAIVIYFEEFVSWISPRKGKSLKGEVILITGSAGGLGHEICKQLSTSGAKLVLWDVSSQMNKETAATLRQLGAQHVYEDTVDISDRSQVLQAADKVRNTVGHVTILVNNAGIAPINQFLDLTPNAIRKTFDVNVISQFWTIQEFLPHMIKNNHGHIVTIASTMAHMSMRGSAPYFASKHSVHGFIESLKNELVNKGCTNVKFTTAYPFFIKTALVQDTGLQLKFKFPSITPFMDASWVAEKVVEAVKCEQEFLYLPRSFRLYLLLQALIPSKLHHALIDFFVEQYDIPAAAVPVVPKEEIQYPPNNNVENIDCIPSEESHSAPKLINRFSSAISKPIVNPKET